MENENTSHTARKTVAKMNIPRFVPSEISPFDTPAIQAIVSEKPSARSIATADVHPRIRIVSRYATTAGSVGGGAYAGGGPAGPGASKSFLLPSGWRLRPDKGS